MVNESAWDNVSYIHHTCSGTRYTIQICVPKTWFLPDDRSGLMTPFLKPPSEIQRANHQDMRLSDYDTCQYRADDLWWWLASKVTKSTINSQSSRYFMVPVSLFYVKFMNWTCFSAKQICFIFKWLPN